MVVAAKALTEAKSRLAPALNGRQRRLVATRLLEQTFDLLCRLLEKHQIAGFVVISSDDQILQLAEKYKGQALLEELPEVAPQQRLNAALAVAGRWCSQQKQAAALLLLPSDLPLLKLQDLQDLLNCLKTYPNESLAVIAPDHQEKGTNALLLHPPALLDFTYCFGDQSFTKHLTALSQQEGIKTVVYNRPGLAFDLDYPKDLEKLPLEVQRALLAF